MEWTDLQCEGQPAQAPDGARALLWKQVAVPESTKENAHGRLEKRRLTVVTVFRGISFPHAAQAI